MVGMLVQRVHYEMKRMLAEKQNLEFGWRQVKSQRERGSEADRERQTRTRTQRHIYTFRDIFVTLDFGINHCHL